MSPPLVLLYLGVVAYSTITIQGNSSAALSNISTTAGVFELKFDGNRYAIFTYYVTTEGVTSVGAVTSEKYSSLIGFETNSSRQLVLKNLSNSTKTFFYRKL